MKKAPRSPMLRTLDSFLEGRRGGWFISIIIIPLLCIFALVLPPIALPQRILSAGYSGVSASKGGGVSSEDGTQFSVPAGASKNGVSLKLTSMSQAAFMKSALAKDIPATLDVKSQYYQLGLQGEMPSVAIVSIPIPEGVDPLSSLDVYAYSGKKWAKVPFQFFLDEVRLEAYLTDSVPEGILLAQTKTVSPAVSTELAGKTAIPAPAAGIIGEVHPTGFTIADSGGIAGSIASTPETSANSPYQVIPTISNVLAEQLRSDLTDIMVTDAATRKRHIQTLVDLSVEKLYRGLFIDYQGISPDNRKDFSLFIRDLAQALHAKDKVLGVSMAMPMPKTTDMWDSGAYDWAAIGKYADFVKIPLPTSRQAYEGNPPIIQSYLQWAVGQVDRYKIQLAVSVGGRDEFGTSYAPVSYSTVLKLLGPMTSSDKPDATGKVTFDLPKIRESGFQYQATTGLYTFTYRDEKGQSHTVSLESGESLSKKIGLAIQYNLRGVSLRDVMADGVDPRAWEAIKQYRSAQAPSLKTTLALVWRVDGQVVGKSFVADPKFSWTAPAGASTTNIEIAFSFDDGQSTAGSTGPTPIQVAVVQPTPTLKATPKPTTAPQPTSVPKTSAPSASVPTKAPAVPQSTAPRASFGYGLQVTGGDPGGEAADLKSLGFNWVKIQVPWQDFESSKGVASLGSIDNFVNIMSGNGIKVLLSIVKAPAWSRRQYGDISRGNGPPDNMQDAADFMGGVAGMYCGKVQAIEVWNEENLDVEWHDKRGVSAALYMEMLKKAYASIKSKCPSTAVISGAPTPTGGGGATAIDDVEYLRQLYANGLKNYSDGIGAHPSGFRSSPECKLSTPGCAGPYADHRSFFFRDTMEAYHAVMVQFGDGNKQVWATEFGWPVGTGGGAHPAGQWNNFETVAGYYARAFQWGKSQPWVGPMFGWCWDFSGGEVGAFRIKGTPAENALRTMPK